MRTNESTLDRVIRIILASAALVVALLVGAGSPIGVALLVVAAVMLITGLVGFCPVYRILGMRTRKG